MNSRKSRAEFAFLMVAFASIPAFASESTICEESGGPPYEFRIGGIEHQFCRFFDYGISTESLYLKRSGQKVTEAVSAFLNGSGTRSLLTCEINHGRVDNASDRFGNVFTLCFFRDGSFVENSAVDHGPLYAARLMSALVDYMNE